MALIGAKDGYLLLHPAEGQMDCPLPNREEERVLPIAKMSGVASVQGQG